jgi:hypothetical protein
LALSTLAKVFLYIGGVGGGVQRCQKARAAIRGLLKFGQNVPCRGDGEGEVPFE